jgi:hypothetical protein
MDTTPISCSTELKLVPDPKPCAFCICESEKKALVRQAFSVCGCPCHKQNMFGLADWLRAVKYFFGDELSKL